MQSRHSGPIGLSMRLRFPRLSSGALAGSSIAHFAPSSVILIITSESALRNGVFPAVSVKEEIFTIKELATHLRVHPTTIYRLLRQGHLPGFRVGSNWRFRRSLIEQWQTSQPSERLMPIARGRKKRG
jgi:excisionase family DNA binding protein